MAKDSQAKLTGTLLAVSLLANVVLGFSYLALRTESILGLDGAGRTWRSASSRDVTSPIARTCVASCAASGLNYYSLSVGVTFKAFGTRLTAG